MVNENNETLNSTYFFIHGERLSKEFNSFQNKERRKNYRESFTKEEQYHIFSQWQNMLNKQKTDIQFLDYIENISTNKYTKPIAVHCPKIESPKLNDIDMLKELISNLEDQQLKSKYTKKMEEIFKSTPTKTVGKPTFLMTTPIILNQISECYEDINQNKSSLENIKQTMQPTETKMIPHNSINTITGTHKSQYNRTLKNKITSQELSHEIKNIKKQIVELKHANPANKESLIIRSTKNNFTNLPLEPQIISIQRWNTYINIKIHDMEIETIALIDTGANMNCIQEGLIPTKYYHKTIEQLVSANGSQMDIQYKLPKVHICQNNVCFQTSFILVKNMTDNVILGLPFIGMIYPFTTNNIGITTTHLGKEITFKFF